MWILAGILIFIVVFFAVAAIHIFRALLSPAKIENVVKTAESASIQRTPAVFQGTWDSEKVWQFMFGEFKSLNAEHYLSRQRETFLPLARGKSRDEKLALLSRLEFDKFRGQTLLRKQTKEEKLATVNLLDFKIAEPCETLKNLRKAFAPYPPYFFALRGQIEFPELDWQIKSWHAAVQKGCAIKGETIPTEKLLELLSLKALSELCVKLELPVAKRKLPMIESLVKKSLHFDEFKSYFRGIPFLYIHAAPSERERLEDYWEVCRNYLTLAHSLEK